MFYIYCILALCCVGFLLFFFQRRSAYKGDSAVDTATLAPYARDISIFTISPSSVFFPKNVNDIVHLVTEKNKEKKTNPSASLTVRAGGTCMSGGPLNSDSIVDMTRYMNKVSINPKALTATVETGAYFRDIEDKAKEHGLMFAPYPSSRRICGIGGMIGNNASGEKSVRFGATSDNILSMEVVLADGSVVTVEPKKVSSVTDKKEQDILKLALEHGSSLREATGAVKKSASGYRLEKVLSGDTFNLVPLFCGAQGTLGIVTKAVLKLVPIPKHVSLLVISAKVLEDIPVIVDEIFKWNPEAVETFDINTFNKAREHLQEHAQRTLPYVDENAHLFILAEFSEETEEATKHASDSCFKNLKEKGYAVEEVTNEVDISSIWEVRRNSFLLMRDHNPEGFKAVPCIEDVVVPVSALAEFIHSLHAILNRRGIAYGFHGHIGDGSLRIVPVFNLHSDSLFSEITGLMDEVFEVVKRLRGNMSADHSDGIIRTPFLKAFYGEKLYSVFEEIKYIYDPLTLMNPGKKVGGTREDIQKHFDFTGPQ